ncbi:hypothetical protein MTO96_035751 [Rhipicephalus appendiculatus]
MGLSSWKYSFVFSADKFGMLLGSILAERMGLLEFLWGAGNMAGSYIGGYLIEAWDYPLPFFVLGVLAVATLPIVVKLRRQLEDNAESNQPDLTEAEANINYLWLFVDPIFLADMVTLTMVWIILGFDEPTLEPSLTKGDGWCMVLGQLTCTIGFLVMAPVSFIATESHVLQHVMSRGYPNNFRTSSFVSSCVFFLAIVAVVTPPVAGYVYDTFGYQNACLALSCFLGAWIPFTIAVWIQTTCKTSRSKNITTMK